MLHGHGDARHLLWDILAHTPLCGHQTTERASVVACLSLHGASFSHPQQLSMMAACVKRNGSGWVRIYLYFTRKPGEGAKYAKCYVIHCQDHSCMVRLVGGGRRRWCEQWRSLVWGSDMHGREGGGMLRDSEKTGHYFSRM
jgi:hypothetical protein